LHLLVLEECQLLLVLVKADLLYWTVVTLG
jgi:hypothetical protein